MQRAVADAGHRPAALVSSRVCPTCEPQGQQRLRPCRAPAGLRHGVDPQGPQSWTGWPRRNRAAAESARQLITDIPVNAANAQDLYNRLNGAGVAVQAVLSPPRFAQSIPGGTAYELDLAEVRSFMRQWFGGSGTPPPPTPQPTPPGATPTPFRTPSPTPFRTPSPTPFRTPSPTPTLAPEPDAVAGPDLGARADALTDADPGAGPDAAADAHLGAGPDAAADADPGAGPDATADADPGPGPDAATDADSGPWSNCGAHRGRRRPNASARGNATPGDARAWCHARAWRDAFTNWRRRSHAGAGQSDRSWRVDQLGQRHADRGRSARGADCRCGRLPRLATPQAAATGHTARAVARSAGPDSVRATPGCAAGSQAPIRRRSRTFSQPSAKAALMATIVNARPVSGSGRPSRRPT